MVLHELSHAWFNRNWFSDRWLNEGFAQTYSNMAVDELGGNPLSPDLISPSDPGHIALNDWSDPDFTDGTSDRETFGYGAAFGHGLGHGFGLEIHEPPRAAMSSVDTLTAGMTITVEPGIYVEGLCGVRIEDCCVVTDGGGALVVVSPEIAATLPRRSVKLLGQGEAAKDTNRGRIDLSHTGAVWSGPRAFAEAGVTPADIDYASIYDSFTITVLVTLEDLGFCAKGQGGRFVMDGGLVAPFGRLPFNTDGGGLCNNHPANRGGMTKVIEAVRQLRGEAHPAVQVPDCQLALAHGTGGALGTRMMSSTLILGQPDA